MPKNPLQLLGIPSCDTCKRALKSLNAAGLEVSFRDIRAEPLSREERAHLLSLINDALVNRKSTTWRGLSDNERRPDPAVVLAAHPTLMKRPVIRDGDDWTLGWDRAVQERFLN